MSQTLGEKLRQAREERGISISEVAEQTRISPHYIKSIENDDYKTLPGGIFNKGFVKSYARYVGMDEAEALQDYAQLAVDAEQQPDEDFRAYRPEVLTDDRNMAAMMPTIAFAVIILALMTAGVLILVRYIGSRAETPAANVSTAANSQPANGAANIAGTTAETPAAPAASDGINIELKALGEPVWTSYTVDGEKNIQTVEADQSVKVTAKESFKISYSKAKIDKLRIDLNGKQIEPPNDPAKGTVDFEINRANAPQIMESGKVSERSSTPERKPAATAERPAETPSRTPAATATPKPKTSPSVKPTQSNPLGRPRVAPTPRAGAQ
jgi:cytoskeletal protein RodZ